MKITKYLHSCLLLQEGNNTVLIDPGIYTYNAKALDLQTLPRLDYLLITHEHPDHFHLPFVKEILQKFPTVTIVTNPTLANLLAKENIKATHEEDEIIKCESVPHEQLWDKQPPEHVAFNVFNKLTHPGDSLNFANVCPILALPLTAPWGSTTEAVSKALRMNPKFIIPIHDWMWKDEIRVGMYQRLKEFFTIHNIQFKGLETGEMIEV